MMLHTLIPYWESLIAPQTPSTPIEYLVAVALFGLMVVGLDWMLNGVVPAPARVRKD